MPSLPHSSAVKYVRLLFIRISGQSASSSVSPQTVVLATALQAGDTDCRVHVSSGKDGILPFLPFPRFEGPDVICLPSRVWLVSLDGALSGAQLWSLLQADQTLSRNSR